MKPFLAGRECVRDAELAQWIRGVRAKTMSASTFDSFLEWSLADVLAREIVEIP